MQQGFTLVETLIAILVLAIAITAGFGAISSGLRAAYLAKNQVIAFYLVQDAFEYIRNIRDTEKITGFQTDTDGWYSFAGTGGAIEACITGTCKIDTTSPITTTSHGVSSCGGTCPFLHYDPQTGIYDYDTSKTATSFTRTISITPILGTPPPGASEHREVEVAITVSWKEVLATKTFTVKSILFESQ